MRSGIFSVLWWDWLELGLRLKSDNDSDDLDATGDTNQT